MRKVWIATALLVALVFAGCAFWSNLTTDEKMRVVSDMVQDQLEVGFDGAKAFVMLHPEEPNFMQAWKEEIVPAFDVTNRTMHDVVLLVSRGGTTEVMKSLGPEDWHVILGTALESAIRSWKFAKAVMLKDIPEWSAVLDKNLAFQVKIDAELAT